MLFVKALSSLQKVFLDEAPEGDSFVGFSLFQGEYGSFQIAVQSEKAIPVTIKIDSDLAVSSFVVEHIPAGKVCNEQNSDDYYLRKTPGLYPDLLRLGSEITADENYRTLWFEIEKGNYAPGDHAVTVSFLRENELVGACTVTVHIIPAVLPDPELLCTHWFHTDCIHTYYDVPVFSEAYWRITENFVRVAVRHGVNFLLTPLFTPPLDTAVGKERPTVQLVDVEKTKKGYVFGFDKLHRWFTMCENCGVRYFEMSHLFTQWGAKHAPKIMATVNGEYKQIFGWKTNASGRRYTSFLKAFGKALCAFLEKEGMQDRCYFHVSDEPAMRDIHRYAKRSRLIRKAFPGYPIMDALSDFAFYQKGLLPQPIPCIDHADAFVGNVPENWTYYCCGPGNGYYPNRFFAMPSERSRILGLMMYKYDIKGFLQWGLNFWYSQFSDHPIDPFRVPDADKRFPAGDAFVLYPGENGEPLVSLRFKVFREAIQDKSALLLLEKLVGREEALRFTKDITWNTYPHDGAWLLNVREKIGKAVEEALKQETEEETWSV